MNKKGAISIFALLSMMFFLIFIMAAYNNVMQKSRTEVETKGALADFYKSAKAAETTIASLKKENVNGIHLNEKLNRFSSFIINANANKYIYLNGGVHKIVSPTYQQVEYVQSSGTQFIDTGINPSGIEVGVDITFQMVNLNHDTWFFGENEFSSLDTGSIQFGVHSGKFHISSTNYNHVDLYRNGTIITADTNKHNLKYNIKNYGTTFDNTVLINTVSGGTQSGNIIDTALHTMCIFGRNGNVNFPASVRIYDLKIYNGTQLIRSYVPCYRKSDNVIGMYDTVNNVFYTNAGTGTFIKGPNV